MSGKRDRLCFFIAFRPPSGTIPANVAFSGDTGGNARIPGGERGVQTSTTDRDG